MRPSFAVFNPADGVFSNAIVGGYLALKPRISTNGGNLRFGQLGASATLAPVGSSMLNPITLIVLRGIPSQVFNAIVPRIAVVMAALHFWRARPNKSGQHQCVRLRNFDFVVSPKAHKGPVLLSVERVGLDLARFCGAHVSMIRNLVQTFVPNNRQPSFHVYPLMLHTGIIA